MIDENIARQVTFKKGVLNNRIAGTLPDTGRHQFFIVSIQHVDRDLSIRLFVQTGQC
jgi:hypothetical protein